MGPDLRFNFVDRSNTRQQHSMAGEEESRHREKRRKHSHSDHRSEKTDRLPYDARPITKDDMESYSEVFARYLYDRKGIEIKDISSIEAYARFKSFVHKW